MSTTESVALWDPLNSRSVECLDHVNKKDRVDDVERNSTANEKPVYLVDDDMCSLLGATINRRKDFLEFLSGFGLRLLARLSGRLVMIHRYLRCSVFCDCLLFSRTACNLGFDLITRMLGCEDVVSPF